MKDLYVVYLNTHLRFTGSVLNGLQNKKLCRIEGENSSVQAPWGQSHHCHTLGSKESRAVGRVIKVPLASIIIIIDILIKFPRSYRANGVDWKNT